MNNYFVSFYPQLLFLEKVEKHALAWPPATYDVISRNDSNRPPLNVSQNAREG